MEARLEDLSMMYSDALVLYKDKPVYVLRVGAVFDILDLESQEMNSVKFTEKDFSSLSRRVGMVNIGSDCVYVSRNPVRKYSVGLNHGNVKVQQLAGASSVSPFKVLYATAKGLREVGLANAINNKYPAFTEALSGSLRGGCQAFDKQFAVDKKGRVFYKTKEVGCVSITAKSEEEIEFNSGYSYLRLLLQNNYRLEHLS